MSYDIYSPTAVSISTKWNLPILFTNFCTQVLGTFVLNQRYLPTRHRINMMSIPRTSFIGNVAYRVVNTM